MPVPSSITRKTLILQTLVDGAMIHSVELGLSPDSQGPEFVLVHGLGMSSRYMMPTAEWLGTHGRVHALDLPGFGHSAKARRTLSIPQLADVLANWLEKRKISDPVLIGNSLGAQVVAEFASRYPQQVNSAVLSAPTVDPDARIVSAQLFRLLRDMPREPAGLYWIGLMDYLKAGWVTILETLQFALAHRITEALARIPVPVLLISGGRDPIMPETWRKETTAGARIFPDTTGGGMTGSISHQRMGILRHGAAYAAKCVLPSRPHARRIIDRMLVIMV